MGIAYYKDPPSCPTHGKMKVCVCGGDHHGGTVYICVGFDGEGCDYVVSSDDLPWKLLGQIQDIDWFRYESTG